jgi:hypothetical protein
MFFRYAATCLTLLAVASPALALELDWSGQFRSEFNFVHNYGLDSSDGATSLDPARNNGGYYILPGGSNDANFQSLFLKLQPKLVVNDNIYIKSEWWLGDPVYGFFGNAVPYQSSQRSYDSTFSRGSAITAQRFWGEFLSDIGTIQVGRAPLNWGLGTVWSAGDGLWDHYESTGDVVRLVSKFGAFTVTPQFIYYSAGNAFGGAGEVGPGPGMSKGFGSGTLADYSLSLKYENPDEDFEGGVNLIHRLSGANQDSTSGYQGPIKNPINGSYVTGINYNTWDLYAKKRFGKFTLAGEAPIQSGSIGGVEYSAFALALEGNWKPSDTFEFDVRAGHAPGQPNSDNPNLESYKAFYFHPNQHLGMVMFNYALHNFHGPNTANNPNLNATSVVSPYGNSITNANYLALGSTLHAGDKWDFKLGFAFANALESAENGKYFFNSVERKLSTLKATSDQEKSLGWELDWGTGFRWDEYFRFDLDFGIWFPGGYYKFSNGTVDNPTSAVFATSAKIGVKF